MSRSHPRPEPPPHPVQIEQQGSRWLDPPRCFQIRGAQAMELIHKRDLTDEEEEKDHREVFMALAHNRRCSDPTIQDKDDP